MAYKWEQSTDQQNWITIANQTGQNYTFNDIVSQRLYFRRTTISGTCTALSNVVAIETGNTVTVAIAGSDQGRCNMQEAHLNANLPLQYETGTWTVLSPSTFNPFNNTNVHDPKAIITNIPVDVDVKLRWRIANNVCLQYTESEVTLRNESLPVVFAGNDVSLELGNSTVLHPQINALPGYTVQWTPVTGLSSNSINEPVATPTETTSYQLTVTSVAGCESVSYINVNVKNDLVIPNSITPNGDGINDIWNIKNIYAYKGISISVFTRWGQQVFYSNGYAKPWDGTYNGKILSAGVYYYIIKTDDNKVKKAGSVTVIY
jgi:gliding motility-associated-like protein